MLYAYGSVCVCVCVCVCVEYRCELKRAEDGKLLLLSWGRLDVRCWDLEAQACQWALFLDATSQASSVDLADFPSSVRVGCSNGGVVVFRKG